MSANEHLVPEALFDDPNTPVKEAEGISAVKALKIAMQQGQKVYTITQANQATVLPLLNHSANVMQDIQNALVAGKVVTVSANKISYNGWTGSGYILLDQNTGAGAYLIGGGADGGETAYKNTVATTILCVIGFLLAAAIALPAPALIYLLLSIIILSSALQACIMTQDPRYLTFALGAVVAFLLVPFNPVLGAAVGGLLINGLLTFGDFSTACQAGG